MSMRLDDLNKPMTAGYLRELLARVPDDTPVLIFDEDGVWFEPSEVELRPTPNAVCPSGRPSLPVSAQAIVIT